MERSSEVKPVPRVLITGASGFLGRYAVDEFIQHGYEVIATGRNQEALEATRQPGVETVVASLEDLRTADFSVDTVVHLAALSSPWGRWRDFYSSNVAGTSHVIEFAQRNEVGQVIFTSTPSIYSERGHHYDISEDDFEATKPLNHYIRSKVLAETALKNAYDQGNLERLAIMRPRGLIGVGDPSMIPRLLKANKKIGVPLFNDGNNLVDLTCVENVALALRLASENSEVGYGVYNITNGEPRKFKEILDEFFDAIKEKPRYLNVNFKVLYGLAYLFEKTFAMTPNNAEPPFTRYTVSTLGYSQTLDISKAKNELGYQPQIGLSEGIQKYAADYRSTNG